MTIANALSDEHRVRILAIIEGREHWVFQMIELLGLAASTISKHRSILKHGVCVSAGAAGRETEPL